MAGPARSLAGRPHSSGAGPAAPGVFVPPEGRGPHAWFASPAAGAPWMSSRISGSATPGERR